LKTTLRLAVLAFVFGVATFPSQAATITVAAGEVAVSPSNGKCSLREAILNAETAGDTSGGDCAAGTAGANIISLAAGSTYVLPDQDPNHIDGEVNGLPEIHNQITINGNAATVQRDPALFSGTACGGVGAKFRILYVSSLGDLTLTNVTLQNGCANAGGFGAGGAIFNRGALSLDTVTLTNNEALRSGGAIHNDGTLTLTRSTVSNNAVTAVDAGGGGIVNRGTMQVVQSTISGNNGAGAGGGVDTGMGNATLANSTLSGNVSEGDGGGIFNRSASTTVVNTSLSLNRGTNHSAAGLGSGIYVASGAVTLTNSLVAQQANGANCFSVSGGGNNLDNDSTCPTATFSATPMIGPLADNGGPTLTHALLPGSPAIDAGNTAISNASPVSSIDQRGVSRPQGAASDIGAFEIVKYSVTYDGNGNNGGSAPTDSNTYAAGETVTVLSNTGGLVKTGYSFAGWNTAANGSGTAYAPGATFTMPAANTALYAQWTINAYTVTYNGNGNTGGSAPIDASSPHNYNSMVTVLGAGSLTKAGYTFAGWNTAPDGSGTAYAPGATFSMPAANTTLYAQWTINAYTVTYNGNGNTGGSAPVDPGSPYNYNSTVTALGAGSLSRTGYNFAGWNTAANGSGTGYAVGATFNMPAANTTLYAQWTINSYTVTYNGNGSNGGSAPVDPSSPYSYNSTVTVLGPGGLTRTGYTFAGWNMAADGSGTAYAAGATFTMPAANTTLYAQWTINSYTVTYNGNGNTSGSAPVDGSSPHNYNSTVTAPGAGSLIKTGYTLTGWNTAADGSGTAYAAGATFSMPAADTTLYAQWAINTYTVTYSGNGSTGGSAPVDPGSPYSYNSTVTVLGPGSLTRTNYLFAGWNAAADGSGTTYAPGATFTVPPNVTLFAQWTMMSISVPALGPGMLALLALLLVGLGVLRSRLV
jgi:uncharacterized repeat protein (TIGR02543 family)